MKDWVAAVARPAVLAMKAYASARSSGAPDGDAVLLDANESPWSGLPGDLNRYPEPKPERLAAALASLYETSPQRLFLGRGSDEAIDCLLRCFCEAGKSSIVTLSPSYGVYETAAEIQGAAVIKVVLQECDGFAVSAASVIAALREDTRLVFLCSPNNPTGRSIAPGVVREICGALRERALVVLDEAYIEFSDRPSLAAEAGGIENLVVLRTLSKAWGLAGIRVGAAAAFPEVIELLDRVRAPYPLARPVIDAALEALSEPGRMRARVARINGERVRLAAAISKNSVVAEVFPSDANFLLVRLRGVSADASAARLRLRGIIVRARSPFLRVSVGSPEENDRLLASLDELGEGACEK